MEPTQRMEPNQRAIDQVVSNGTNAMLGGGLQAISNAIAEGASPHMAAGRIIGETLFRMESSINESGKRLKPAELKEAARRLNAEVASMLHEGGLVNIKSQNGARNFAQRSMLEAVSVYGNHVKQSALTSAGQQVNAGRMPLKGQPLPGPGPTP